MWSQAYKYAADEHISTVSTMKSMKEQPYTKLPRIKVRYQMMVIG